VTYASVVAVLLLALGWLLLGGRGDAPEPTARRRVDSQIDYSELEEAEREVQAADDADAFRNWGAGATPPPLV
jgi:hypothetical protein